MTHQEHPKYPWYWRSSKQRDPRDEMSPEEEQAYYHDVMAALVLLQGRWRTNKPGITEFLSATTKPTEKEARAALGRVLERQNVPEAILIALAKLFALERDDQRKLVFKNLSQGHANPDCDYLIQMAVDAELYDWIWIDEENGEDIRNEKTRQEAYETVAKLMGLSPEQVKRIDLAGRKRTRRPLAAG